MFSRRKHQWAHLITPELRHHFANVVGYDLVKFDVQHHRYSSPDKHRAAIAWMHEQSGKILIHVGLWIAGATLAATVVSIAVTIAIQKSWL